MLKPCEHCPRSFEARVKTARFCSAKCRKAAFVKRHETVGPAADGAPSHQGTTTDAVRARLEQAGRLDTYLGRAAVALAYRVDTSTAVMGFASLVKQLQQTMEAALEGAAVAADPVDELRARRDRKYAS